MKFITCLIRTPQSGATVAALLSLLGGLLFGLDALGAENVNDPRTAAAGLIHRVLPGHEREFVVEVIPAETAGDVFELETRDGRVVLRGNNGVAIASALNWYLKYFCRCHVSFTGGSQLKLPRPLPPVAPKVRRVSSARYRYFLNYCCYGYSLPWFDWRQWERLIDWMALNGINLPLSVTVRRRSGRPPDAGSAWMSAPCGNFWPGRPTCPSAGWVASTAMAVPCPRPGLTATRGSSGRFSSASAPWA